MIRFFDTCTGHLITGSTTSAGLFQRYDRQWRHPITVTVIPNMAVVIAVAAIRSSKLSIAEIDIRRYHHHNVIITIIIIIIIINMLSLFYILHFTF